MDMVLLIKKLEEEKAKLKQSRAGGDKKSDRSLLSKKTKASGEPVHMQKGLAKETPNKNASFLGAFFRDAINWQQVAVCCVLRDAVAGSKCTIRVRLDYRTNSQILPVVLLLHLQGESTKGNNVRLSIA